MKNPIFVPYGIAVLAKQKGFDEDCLSGYSEGKVLEFTPSATWIPAPAYFQLMNWLREHRYELTIHTISNVNEVMGYEFRIYSPMSWPVHRVTVVADSWEYFEVCNEALAYALSALPDKI